VTPGTTGSGNDYCSSSCSALITGCEVCGYTKSDNKFWYPEITKTSTELTYKFWSTTASDPTVAVNSVTLPADVALDKFVCYKCAAGKSYNKYTR